MRFVLLGSLWLLVLNGCSTPKPTGDAPVPSPGLELSTESYPAARSRFQTTLLRPGPAHRSHNPIPTPPGAIAVKYLSDGRSLQAFASPFASKSPINPKAAVLFLHGGFSFGIDHWELTHPFQDAGFVVLVPTLRGENGQDGACSLFYNEVADVLAAADALAARPDVDRNRIYLAGHSVGGTLTLLAALTSSRFRAAVSFSGAPDLIEYTRGRDDLIPFPSDRLEEFRLRSAVVFATGFRCPVRLFYGEDEIWLQSATRRTALLAAQAGLDVAAVEIPGGHDSANSQSIAEAIAFFRSR